MIWLLCMTFYNISCKSPLLNLSCHNFPISNPTVYLSGVSHLHGFLIIYLLLGECWPLDGTFSSELTVHVLCVWKVVHCHSSALSHVWLFANPYTVPQRSGERNAHLSSLGDGLPFLIYPSRVYEVGFCWFTICKSCVINISKTVLT